MAMLAVTTIPIPVLIGIAVVLLVLVRGVKMVQQGTVAVVTTFGRYTRVIRPGIGFVVPFVPRWMITVFPSSWVDL